MRTKLIAGIVAAGLTISSDTTLAQDFSMEFERGVDGWRTVVDGVMGGLSTGRVSSPQSGVMRFSGDLSLENNGGFSQVRTAVDGADFEGAQGIEVEVRGDGRTYKFDVRLSNVRMMAGAYQQDFKTTEGTWETVRLPFEGFRLYSFGRLVSGAPEIIPTNIESIGVSLSDKQPGPFQLDVRSIRAYGSQGAASPKTSGGELATVATEAGLTTLLRLVEAAEMTLPDEPVTIFAPTNDAFAALPKEQVDALLRPEARQTLRSILAYHVVAGAKSSSEVLSRRSLETLNGQSVRVGSDGGATVGTASIVATDVAFDGGVVHVVDAVLMPELRSITAIASETDELSTLVAAIKAAGLADQLGPENGPWTVFAPVNDAFAALPDGALGALLEPANRQQLVSILALHVVPGRLEARELLGVTKTQALTGEVIRFGTDRGTLQVNGASIIASDIQAGNGVVHLIDAVLLPSSSGDDRTTPGTFRAGAARLYELAVEQGVPLFNAGQHAACAAIYEVTIESMLLLGRDELEPRIVERLEQSLAEARREPRVFEKAWIYRRAMDAAYQSFVRPSSQSGSR
ncbi:MAG: CIA30 family protein [Phycisphaerales bacterium]